MGLNILGIAGSLRNIINKELSQRLIRDLKIISNEELLMTYLSTLATLPNRNQLPENLPEPLLEIYFTLAAKKNNRGLSNSEVALSASLWKAHQHGADISYCSLNDYFLSSQKTRNLYILKKLLLEADAFLLSGPVYFGDRGSLIHELICLLRKDTQLLKHLQGKFYGGISVGAKRNGGQETTLIYQILDMISLGFLAVGNDSDTTSQYGGTCHAGDLGSISMDHYGLKTSMGIGRRLANLLNMFHPNSQLKDKIKVMFIILQDSNSLAKDKVSSIINRFSTIMEATVVDATKLQITRCLACDVCPKSIDIDETYRCKIVGDDFSTIHEQIIEQDAFVPVALSAIDQTAVKTNYQVFIERTRYLRRGDYALTDTMISPLLFHEHGFTEHLDIRMITSFIRHQTVISKPIIGHISAGKLVNETQAYACFENFLNSARKLAAARLFSALKGGIISKYNPIGYVVNAAKDKEPLNLRMRRDVTRKRFQRLAIQAVERLVGK